MAPVEQYLRSLQPRAAGNPPVAEQLINWLLFLRALVLDAISRWRLPLLSHRLLQHNAHAPSQPHAHGTCSLLVNHVFVSQVALTTIMWSATHQLACSA
jgi:hypothetical protein